MQGFLRIVNGIFSEAVFIELGLMSPRGRAFLLALSPFLSHQHYLLVLRSMKRILMKMRGTRWRLRYISYARL